MAIIRKWLTPLEIMPGDLRYNETCDCFERSPDGGVTWNEDEGADPRHNPAYQLPPDPTGDPECDAAARLVHLFQDNLEVFYSSVDAAQYATFFLANFLILTPVIGILTGVALLAFDAFIEIGQAAMEAAFTEEVWDSITCIIRCHLSGDGQVSLEQRDAIMADIAALHPGTVYNTLVNVVNLFGEVLMSNAAVEYDDIGDCSECSCDYCWQWYGSDLGTWGILLPSHPPTFNGTEWEAFVTLDSCADHAYIYIDRTLGTTTNIGEVHVHTPSYPGGFTSASLQVYLGGVLQSVQTATAAPPYTDWGFDFGALPGDRIVVAFNACGAPSGFLIEGIHITGNGDTPTTGVECP